MKIKIALDLNELCEALYTSKMIRKLTRGAPFEVYLETKEEPASIAGIDFTGKVVVEFDESAPQTTTKS